VIRLLQPRYKRRFTVSINAGMEQTASVGRTRPSSFPDLCSRRRGGKKLAGVIESRPTNR